MPEPRPPKARSDRSVYLVGFMGSGKTTIGKALAGKLGLQFVDLDDEIERREALTVAQIFERRGEAAFRSLETRELKRQLADKTSRRVIALGGGAFVQAENMALLENAKVPTVFLDGPAELLWQRCNQDPRDRPLRRSYEEFAQLYQVRRPAYLRASYRVESSIKTPAEIADELVTHLLMPAIEDQENLH